MAPKISPVSVRDAETLQRLLGEPVHDLIYAEAEHDPRGGAVILMKVKTRGPSQMDLSLVLSPSAAHQFSRALRKAVKDYLNHSPETE